MQDDSLNNGKLANGQSSSSEINVDQVNQMKDDGISMVRLVNGLTNNDIDQEQSLNHDVGLSGLPMYNGSPEPILNNVIGSNSGNSNLSADSSSLWSSPGNDSMLNDLNSSTANGSAFQRYNDKVTLFDANLVNHAGISQQIQPTCRAYSPNGYSQLTRNTAAPVGSQQNMYYQNKAYNDSWWTQQCMSTGQSQNQNNLSAVPSWNRGRSAPNLNPDSNIPCRNISPSFPQNMNVNIGQKNFRRSTSYPGRSLYSESNYDVSNLDGNPDMLLQTYQDNGVGNGYGNGGGPLDNIQALQQCLNEMIRTNASSDLNNDLSNKGSGYLNANLMRAFSQMGGGDRGPFFPTLDEHVVNSIVDDPTGHIIDGQVYLNSIGSISSSHSPLGPTLEKEEKYSRKVFVGGLPPDIDEDEISNSFRRFGALVVDWPHKAESKSYFPPKGYAFLLFQDEISVQRLIDACIREDDRLFLVVSSPTVKDKAVQIRPWNLKDADYVLNASMPLDPRKTVFVGGVPRPLKAHELADKLNDFYGNVCYAGIDTDPELKYPKGAGRVAFSSQQSYVNAIGQRFVTLKHNEIEKRVEVKPYVLDDQMCDECAGQLCNGKFAPFFCANVTCLQYYCEHCWSKIHARLGRETHKPLVKEGADRPRAIQQYRWC